MTESALEKARREVLIGVASLVGGVDLRHFPLALAAEQHAKLNAAIAWLEAAAWEDGKRLAWSESNEYLPRLEVEKKIAAARLAGRVEQAEICFKGYEDMPTFSEGRAFLQSERDRLRREAEGGSK